MATTARHAQHRLYIRRCFRVDRCPFSMRLQPTPSLAASLTSNERLPVILSKTARLLFGYRSRYASVRRRATFDLDIDKLFAPRSAPKPASVPRNRSASTPPSGVISELRAVGEFANGDSPWISAGLCFFLQRLHQVGLMAKNLSVKCGHRPPVGHQLRPVTFRPSCLAYHPLQCFSAASV